MISFVKNRWIPSSLVDVGPDSDSLDVEADLVEIRGSMFPPPVGIFWHKNPIKNYHPNFTKEISEAH